jgi:hypothetical protein
MRPSFKVPPNLLQPAPPGFIIEIPFPFVEFIDVSGVEHCFADVPWKNCIEIRQWMVDRDESFSVKSDQDHFRRLQKNLFCRRHNNGDDFVYCFGSKPVKYPKKTHRRMEIPGSLEDGVFLPLLSFELVTWIGGMLSYAPKQMEAYTRFGYLTPFLVDYMHHIVFMRRLIIDVPRSFLMITNKQWSCKVE